MSQIPSAMINLRWFKSFFLFTMALAVSFCSSVQKEEVSFQLSRYPSDLYKEFSILGLPAIEGLTSASSDYLHRKLKSCGRFDEIKALDLKFDLKGADYKSIENSIGNQMDKSKDARTTHGTLIVRVEKNKGSVSKQNQKLVVYNDDFRYMWAPTYGIWPYNSYGFTGESEISPVGKTAVRDVGLNMRHYEVSIHFTLYNKVLKKIITDGVYEANADVKNYSSEADDIGRNVRQYMTQGILDRIIATTCPETYQVERVLYARGTNDKVDGFIQQGLELAAGGRWEHAASKWKNAILEDKNNALAFHNLGIYYEKKGELTKASEFFDQAEEKNYWKLIEQNRFQKTLEEFVPKLDLAQLQPRVISVRGGRWVSIAGKLGRKFKLRKNYPVVRVEQKINKPNFNNEGLVYTEVGRVQVIQKRGRLILAKIIEFVEDKGIQNGDIILL